MITAPRRGRIAAQEAKSARCTYPLDAGFKLDGDGCARRHASAGRPEDVSHRLTFFIDHLLITLTRISSLFSPHFCIHSGATMVENDSNPQAIDYSLSSQSTQPGMGLPFELWDLIVAFLSHEPHALLACCLTCHSFRKHARNRLSILLRPFIYLNDLTAFGFFAEEIRTIPGRAQFVLEMSLHGHPPLAFSLVLHRFASQLGNLRVLSLSNIHEALNVPSSTWSLYGGAFRRVEDLNLFSVQFPSFIDFTRFITSFRAVKRLRVSYISSAHQGVPLRVVRLPRQLKVLEHMTLRWMEEDGGHFLEAFVRWFSSKQCTVQDLHIDGTIPSHPSSFLLVESIRTHLQELTLNFFGHSPTEASRRSWPKFISKQHP